jgi:ATP-dependent Zn protease
MGGMVAEELFFGDTSTGVAGDLQAATEAAAQMVGSFGMARSLISLESVRAPGGPNLVAKVLSDDACRAEVDSILNAARDDVRSLLAARPHVVAALRDALLERDELIGPEIVAVLEAAEAVPPGGGPRPAPAHPLVVDLRDNEFKPVPPG